MRGMNKKGGEKLLTIWWFFVLAITATAIVVAVVYYYSADIDVRGVEAVTLAEKLGNCLNKNGYLIENFTRDDFNLIKECELSAVRFGRESRLYFNVTITDAISKGRVGKEQRGGDSSYEETCRLISTGEIEAQKYPRCTEIRRKILYRENFQIKEAYITIIAASNQYAEKVQQVSGASVG